MRLRVMGDRLLVGAFPQARDVPDLRAAGVTAIVNVTRKALPVEVRAAVPIVRHRYFPDSRRELDVDTLRHAVYDVLQLLRSGHTVLTSCHYGRDRSVTVAALAEGQRQGWDGPTTLAHARAVRPGCLRNPRLEELVTTWTR